MSEHSGELLRGTIKSLCDQPQTLRTKVLFYFNGERIELDHCSPEDTVYDYLSLHQSVGTKKGCGEGGCGACTVMLSSWNEEARCSQHRAVCACLVPLPMLDHCLLTTVEGVGSISKGLHPVQERMAKAHASQCGFCTPGVVMSVYAGLAGNTAKNKPPPSIADIEDMLAGNLCRCSGYRSIYEAVRTFASNFDASKCAGGQHEGGCAHTNITKIPGGEEKKCGDSPACASCPNRSVEVPVSFPSELSTPRPSLLVVSPPEGHEPSFFRPSSLSELLKLKAAKSNETSLQSVELIAGKTRCSTLPSMELVCGNTDIGYKRLYQREKGRGNQLGLTVSLNGVKELQMWSSDPAGFTVGAGMTITGFQEAIEGLRETQPKEKLQFAEAFLHQLSVFANRSVRNMGTVGGSLVSADHFSDLYPVWLASNSTCTIVRHDSQGKQKSRTVLIRDFLSKASNSSTTLLEEEVVASIFTPWSNSNVFARAFKVSKRRKDCQAIVTACFAVTLSGQNATRNIVEASFGFGGVSDAPTRMERSRTFLSGKQLNATTYPGAVAALHEDLAIALARTKRLGQEDFRRRLGLRLFYKFWVSLGIFTGIETPLDYAARGALPTQRTTQQDFAQEEKGSQVGRSVPHQNSLAHATGEATFTGDIPLPQGGLYSAFVQSKRAFAKLGQMDFADAMSVPGAVGFVTAADIPGSQMLGCLVQDEEVLASEEVHYFGQPIAVVLAKTPRAALIMAGRVKVDYQELSPLILSIEDSIKHKSFFHDWDRQIKRGDVESAFATSHVVVEGQMRTAAAEHFYIEPWNCLVLPDADQWTLHVATQNPAKMQQAVAQVLDLPLQKVVCKVMRLGGAFGGKQDRPQFMVAAVAVAAHKFGKPVRMVMDRAVDMSTTGMRHPYLSKYKMGLSKTGKILGYDVQLFTDGGHSLDLTSAQLDRGMFSIENCYSIPNIRVRGKCCKTHKISNTAFRGFGVPECIAVTETALVHAASVLGETPENVRRANLYTAGDVTPLGETLQVCTVQQCWEQLLRESSYNRALQRVEAFNAKSRFVKKGLAMMPCRSSVFFEAPHMDQAGATVQVYIDGSVHISHGGVEMGQGIHTKMSMIAAQTLGISYESCRTGATETDKVPNSQPTAASSGTDLNGWAVVHACEQINARLLPLKEEFPSASFAELVEKAYMRKISLHASGHFAAPDFVYDYKTKKGKGGFYYAFNSSMAEVELDVLTGDVRLDSVKIVQDAGRSLNPAIDLNQLEGAFLQGSGMWTMEEPIWAGDGHLRTRNTSTYKIPALDDMPHCFESSLLRNAPNMQGGVYQQRSLGEIGIQSSHVVHLAIRQAITAYRSQIRLPGFFPLFAPATVQRICDSLPVGEVGEKIQQGDLEGKDEEDEGNEDDSDGGCVAC